MRKRAIVLVACGVAAAASLVVGPAATAKPQRPAGGTVVIGADQEPVTLNIFLTEGNSYTTALAVNPVLAPGEVYDQHAKLVPLLFDGQPKLLKSNPLTVGDVRVLAANRIHIEFHIEAPCGSLRLAQGSAK